MNLQEYNSFTRTAPPPWAKKAMEVASQRRKMEEQAYKSFSGTDVAEAPLHGLQADVLGCLALGFDLEELLAWAKAKWCAYAAEVRAKVEKAPKIKRGPSSGHSTIGHRWVSDEAWDAPERHIRTLVKVWNEDAHP